MQRKLERTPKRQALSPTLVVLAGLLAPTGPIWAATAAPNLSAVPTGSPLPRVLPQEPPKVAPGLATPAPKPLTSAAPGATVPVATVEVHGSTAYPAGHFAGLLAPLTGNVAQARIEEVRAAILSAYRADGYLFTAVTVSLESGNRLVFSVTEGRIVEVKLDGDIGPAGVQVLRFLNHLVEASPLDTRRAWGDLAHRAAPVGRRSRRAVDGGTGVAQAFFRPDDG
jgi:hemolysin activation/secretion protein